MSGDLIKTYRDFLNQLLNTKCLYKGDKEDDNFVLRRQEILLTLSDEIVEDNLDTLCKNYISFFNDITNTIREKKPVNITDKNFFQYFCKVIEKKSNKCGNIFFLNTNKEKGKINIGAIYINEKKNNAVQIKNYVYMLYIHSCNLLYPNIFTSNVNVPSNTYSNYHDLLKDFEIPEDSGSSDIKGEISSILRDVFPDTDMAEGFGNIMNDPNLSKIIDTVIDTMCPSDKIDELREDIKNVNMDELKSTINSLKEKISTVNLDKIFETVLSGDSENPIENIAKTFEVLRGEGLMENINQEDVMKTFQETIMNESLKEIFNEKKL